MSSCTYSNCDGDGDGDGLKEDIGRGIRTGVLLARATLTSKKKKKSQSLVE